MSSSSDVPAGDQGDLPDLPAVIWRDTEGRSWLCSTEGAPIPDPEG